MTTDEQFAHRRDLVVRTVELADSIDTLRQDLIGVLGAGTLDQLDQMSDVLEDVVAYELAQMPGYYAWIREQQTARR